MAEPGVGTTVGAPWHRRLRSLQSAAAAGVVAAIGWLIALQQLLAAPSIDASDAEVLSFYADPDGLAALVILQILVFGTIGFLWFIGVIRHRVGEGGPKLFDTVFFGGGILMAMLMFVGSAALATPLLMVQETDRILEPDDVAMTRTFAQILLGVIAPRIASLFVFSLSTLALRTGALPRWLVFVSYAVGVVMLVNVMFWAPSVFVFPVWMALVSVVMLVHPPTRPLDA